ncbi:MAG TPA: HEAT repeat domain-containing protein [Candidatus Ozemobacteraceae bacterium]|nr:HEAT repeat domain-containing protein [Candidatus Ozemobacteraceae bacterium]
MNGNVEQTIKEAVARAGREGRFTSEDRLLIRREFETANPRDLPAWLLEALAALPGEIDFLQECLFAQEEALKRLLARYNRPDNDVFFHLLGRLGFPQTSEEKELLKDAARRSDPRLRGIAILRLGECRNDGSGQIILAGLEDAEPYVRKCAVEAMFISLGERGIHAWEHVLSSDRDPEVREAALICLARSGTAGREILQRLSGSLSAREAEYVSRTINS